MSTAPIVPLLDPLSAAQLSRLGKIQFRTNSQDDLTPAGAGFLEEYRKNLRGTNSYE
jgi:hypothetical protein